MGIRACLPGGGRVRRALRSIVLLLSAPLLAAGLSAPAVAQEECHDFDADGAPSGWTCEEPTDCLDRAWRVHPGAPETCNGLDEDCSGVPDEGCDRWCEEPYHPLGWTFFDMEDYPDHGGNTAIVRTDRGILAAGAWREDPDEFNTRRLVVRAWDDEGRPLGPESLLSVEQPDWVPNVRGVRLASAGDRVLVAWQDQYGARDPQLWVQVVDDLGRPVGRGWEVRAFLNGFQKHVADDGWSATWDGDRFVVFWFARSDSLYMTTVPVDGAFEEPETREVLHWDVTGGRNNRYPVAFWNGERYLVFYRTETDSGTDNLRVARVERDGSVFHPVLHHPVTVDKDMVGIEIEDGYALAWTERTNTAPEVAWVTFLDQDGLWRDVPGVIPLTAPLSSGEGSDTKLHTRLAWTGEMIGVAAEMYYTASWVQGDWRWYLWRVLRDGTVLDPDGFLIVGTDQTGSLEGLAWSGREFWAFGVRARPGEGTDGLARERVVCSCADADGDGYDGCFERDCDDGNDAVHPHAAEVCRGWVDDDCDGSIDCDDVDDCPGANGPEAVRGLRWEGTVLAWDAPAGAEVYDLARGLVSDLRRRGDLLASECAGIELVEPSWPDDGRRPPAGDALWYLVRPEGEPCARGPWGTDVDREIRACR